MTYRLFATEAAAQAAELQIRSNVTSFLQANLPDRLTDGGLIGINAADGSLQPDACLTTAWCVPQQVEEGWAVPMPENGQIGQMPLTEFVVGVGGTEVETVTPLPTVPMNAIAT